MRNKLLAIDLSSTCTGYSLWDIESKSLLEYGFLKPSFKVPKVKGIPTLSYPQLQASKLAHFAEELVREIMQDESITYVAIEEINGSKNRLGQKTLDGLHWLLLDRMPKNLFGKVRYFDSDGKTGWRSAQGLKLQLSEQDKMLNKDTKAFNKKIAKGTKKKPVITQKTLAARLVNKLFNLSLDVDVNESDADIADAIGLGYFVLTKVMTNQVTEG